MSRLQGILEKKYLKRWLADSTIAGIKSKAITGRNAFGEPLFTESMKLLPVRVTKKTSKETKDGLNKHLTIEYVKHGTVIIKQDDILEVHGECYDVLSISDKVILSDVSIIIEVELSKVIV